MIVYTCPDCGSDLMATVLTCNPPIHKYTCTNCGWVREEREPVVRIPYSDYTTNASNYSNANPCRGCSNNPVNGGSGICHCILGSNIVMC